MIAERETMTDVPSGLIACDANGIQRHIAAISPRGIWLRTAAPLEGKVRLKLYFYQPETNRYIQFETISTQTGPAQRENDAVLTRFSLESAEIAAEIRRTMNLYARYVETRSEYGASACGQDWIGYPADADEIFCDSAEEQYRLWFENAPPVLKKDCLCEIAVLLDRPALWQAYLRHSLADFWFAYAKVCCIPGRLLPDVPPQRIYIGSESCPMLFPETNLLEALLDRAQRDGLQVSIASAQLRAGDSRMEAAMVLLEQRGVPSEWIVNDWGTLEKLQNHRSCIRPVLGTLLNKRRKDPRMRWTAGFDVDKPLLSENAVNDPAYRRFLRELGIERYEYENTGVPARIPDGSHSLHIPFYRTNSAAWCTLKAMCETGDRGAQAPAKKCAGWCGRNAFLYPLHLKMTGRGNSIFALEDGFPIEPAANIDRIVLNF